MSNRRRGGLTEKAFFNTHNIIFVSSKIIPAGRYKIAEKYP